MRIRFSLTVLAVVLGSLVLGGCAGHHGSTSELLSVSRDPAMKDASYKRILVLAVGASEERRRAVEDAVVSRMSKESVDAVASWTLIPEVDKADPEGIRLKAEQAVKDSGADAALVGILLREDKRTEYAAPQVEQNFMPANPAFMGYGAYVGYGYQTVVTPGEVMDIHEYFLQTSLYDAATEKPVWRAQSKTLNPGSLEQAVGDVADTLVERLLVDGVLVPSASVRQTRSY